MDAQPSHGATLERLGRISDDSIREIGEILRKKTEGEDQALTDIKSALEALSELGDIGNEIIKKTLEAQALKEMPTEADAISYALFREIADNIRGNKELWEVMAGIRRIVYDKGLEGGHAGIDKKANQDARREKESESPTHEDILKWRTVTSIRALAQLDDRTRNECLESVRTKYLTQDEEKLREKFFKDKEEERIRSDIEVATIDELVGIVEIAENSKEKIYEIGKTTALEQLIRRLMTQDKHHIECGMNHLKAKHIRAIIDQMPDSLATGRIGAKALGIILAYAALEDKDTEGLDPKMEELLERCLKQNTSRFLGSNVFKEVRSENPNVGGRTSMLKAYYQRGEDPPEAIYKEIETEMMVAKFPPHRERQLAILFRELHGKPIIVRSSSELEDRLGASFAGQYESVELANCGDFEEDFEKFKQAILKVYGSVFTKNVMEYRKLHNLLQEDEEMGILVQVLNGEKHGDYFYPGFSGMATSFAPQVIGDGVDPGQGSMALAIGLGRAVVDGTGSKFVMLGKPKATGFKGEVPQRKIHVLKLSSNEIQEKTKEELDSEGALPNNIKTFGMGGKFDDPIRWRAITCEGLLKYTELGGVIRYMVQKLKKQLGYEVDCEFTVEAASGGVLKVNLVQCRPQNLPQNLKPSRKPESVKKESTVLEGKDSRNGTFCTNITDLVFVHPKIFEECTATERRHIATFVRIVNKEIQKRENRKYAIMTIKRWESTDDHAGIPAQPADSSNAVGIIEMFPEGTEYSPSFGSHSLQRTLDAQMGTAAFKIRAAEILELPLIAQAQQTLIGDIESALIKEGCPADTARKLIQYVKIIDVDATHRTINSELASEKTPFVAHLAQDNRTGEKPNALYIAKKDEQLPEIVKIDKK